MTVTDTTLDGFFKDRYEDKAKDLVPDFGIIQSDIGFRNAPLLGAEFVSNVRLRRSNGWTFYGSDLDAFALNAAISGQRKPAKIKGSQFVLREAIAYGVIANAKTSKQAFGNAFDDVVMDMTNSAGFALEMALLYGGSDIGVIDSITNVSSGVEDIVITKASWAPGLWAQFEGGQLDIHEPNAGTGHAPSTKLNTNAAVVISSVDVDTRTIRVTGNATDLNAADAADVLVPYDADGAWFDGLRALVPNTGSMHGIDAATYGQWAGNSFAVGGGVLTFLKVQSAGTKILVRSGIGRLVCYVSPFTWTDLNDDEAALRRHVDKAGGDVKVGFRSIDYYGVGGVIQIKAHPMVKAGEAYLISPKDMKRVGSTDLTFDLGIEGQQKRFFRELADNAGFELRNYWNQALLNCKPPAHCRLTGIVDQTL